MSKNLNHTMQNTIKFHMEHTWAQFSGAEVIVGISNYAQDQLGEIVFIELPNLGDEFKQGEVFGQAESLKSVSAIYMPIDGKIVAVNEALVDSPGTVNQSPYKAGWMIKITPRDCGEFNALLSPEEYEAYLQDLINN